MLQQTRELILEALEVELEVNFRVDLEVNLEVDLDVSCIAQLAGPEPEEPRSIPGGLAEREISRSAQSLTRSNV